MRRMIIIFVSLLIITNLTFIASDRPLLISHAQSVPSTISGLWLPASPGTKIEVSQGNNQEPSHLGTEAYAFDFINTDSNNLNFVITAAQSGTVIGFSDNTTLECNENVTSSCQVSIANFVLIANDDGQAASLYLHLLPHSISSCPKPIQVGEHITQGECLGKADTTGSATGPHVHFQVEQLPSLSRQQNKPSEWWYTQSLESTFINPEVLAQDSNGIPLTNQRFTVSAPIASVTPTTSSMPTTQTNCPVTGKANGAVTVPLALGNDPNMVYTFNESTNNNPTSGILKRYDTRTGNKAVIVQKPNTSILDAQVSIDGQWVLFLAEQSNGQSMLQMIRMDGQGLQTLYCFPSGAFVATALWSPDQHSIALSYSQSPDVTSPSFVYLLNIATGALQLELSVPKARAYVPTLWVGNTLIAMTSFYIGVDGNDSKDLYILDTAKQSNHQESELQRISYPLPLTDHATNYDGSYLITSSAQAIGSMGGGLSGDYQGSGSIIAQPINALMTSPSSHTTIYNSSTYAVTGFQVINQKTVLFIINNQNYLGSTDISHNGLWEVNIDGTGLIQLTSDGSGRMSSFDRFSNTNWSNISRDRSLYALLETSAISSQNETQTLLFGSFAGGSPKAIASTALTNGSISIVGWTTM